MRRTIAAALLSLSCLAAALGLSLWAETQLSHWDELLTQTEQAAEQGQEAAARQSARELNTSLRRNGPGMAILCRRDLLAGLRVSFGDVRIFLDAEAREDLLSALGRAREQLRLLRQSFLGTL